MKINEITVHTMSISVYCNFFSSAQHLTARKANLKTRHKKSKKKIKMSKNQQLNPKWLSVTEEVKP